MDVAQLRSARRRREPGRDRDRAGLASGSQAADRISSLELIRSTRVFGTRFSGKSWRGALTEAESSLQTPHDRDIGDSRADAEAHVKDQAWVVSGWQKVGGMNLAFDSTISAFDEEDSRKS